MLQRTIDRCQANESNLTSISLEQATVNSADLISLAAALKGNTHVTSVKLDNLELGDDVGVAIAGMLADNSSITALDLGYNKLVKDTMLKLSESLQQNTTLLELKIHRQEKDMGPEVEKVLIQFWEKNTSLTRLYVTLHDRSANNYNTKCEVRNKEISKRKLAGKEWRDLNPDPEVNKAWRAEQDQLRLDKKAADEAANAPISEKIPSTGGPYTLKQLTCDKEFLPDDITGDKETFLDDAEFEQIFKMDKATFQAQAKWKKQKQKKENKLH